MVNSSTQTNEAVTPTPTKMHMHTMYTKTPRRNKKSFTNTSPWANRHALSQDFLSSPELTNTITKSLVLSDSTSEEDELASKIRQPTIKIANNTSREF